MVRRWPGGRRSATAYSQCCGCVPEIIVDGIGSGTKAQKSTLRVVAVAGSRTHGPSILLHAEISRPARTIADVDNAGAAPPGHGRLGLNENQISSAFAIAPSGTSTLICAPLRPCGLEAGPQVGARHLVRLAADQRRRRRAAESGASGVLEVVDMEVVRLDDLVLR